MMYLLHAYMHVQKCTLKVHNERNLVLCCNPESVYNMLDSLIWNEFICSTLSLKKKIFLALFNAKILLVYTIYIGVNQRLSKIYTTISVIRRWSNVICYKPVFSKASPSIVSLPGPLFQRFFVARRPLVDIIGSFPYFLVQ